jgi:hypothetical protein
MVDHILDMWTFTTIANYHMKQWMMWEILF